MRKVKLFLSIILLFVLSCAKEKSFEHGAGDNTNYETSWQFKDTSVTFGGNATSYTLDDTGMEMEYEGSTTDGLGEISIKLHSLSGAIKQGTYKSEKGEVEFSYSSGGAPRYEANLADSIGEKLTVTILSIDSTSVIGFFTGTARTPSNTVISITEGKFNYRKEVVPTTDSAQGSLGTDADTCTGASITGTYKKGVSLTSANTVAVNVNVTKVGFYTIGTDTLKGIYFNKSGIFTSLGIQTVVLNGIGTPLDSGLTLFKVKYGTSVCGFDITIENVVNSEGTLGATANSCTGVTFAGTLQKNSALTSANTATVEVNITKPGFYTITTDTVNGFYFNGSGTFAASGPQTVVLNGFGTPLNQGETKFKVSYNASSCEFNATVAGEVVIPPSGDEYFQFNDGATVVTAVQDAATLEEASGITAFNLTVTSAGDSTFSLVVTATAALKTGVVYNTSSQLPPTGVFYGQGLNAVDIYTADPTTAGVNVAIKFDVIDLVGKIASGTFSGTAKDQNGAIKTITLGKFKASLN